MWKTPVSRYKSLFWISVDGSFSLALILCLLFPAPKVFPETVKLIYNTLLWVQYIELSVRIERRGGCVACSKSRLRRPELGQSSASGLQSSWHHYPTLWSYKLGKGLKAERHGNEVCRNDVCASSGPLLAVFSRPSKFTSVSLLVPCLKGKQWCLHGCEGSVTFIMQRLGTSLSLLERCLSLGFWQIILPLFCSTTLPQCLVLTRAFSWVFVLPTPSWPYQPV